jgi:hypothetical protein
MSSIPIDSLEVYAYADLAAGRDARSKRRTARQSIVVGGRDWLSRWFWLAVWAGRLTASDFKQKILDMQEQYSPRRFGLEANGMQVLFGSLIREDAKVQFGDTARFIPIYQPTNVDKIYRIRTGIEPIILQGRYFLMESEIEARSELSGFPTAATKDIIDAMEACMNRVAPKRQARLVERRERDEYAAYLRNSGMIASMIEQEMAKYDSKQQRQSQMVN